VRLDWINQRQKWIMDAGDVTLQLTTARKKMSAASATQFSANGASRAFASKSFRTSTSRRCSRVNAVAAAAENNLSDAKVVVIGANGKTGRRCVEYLREKTQAKDIVACTRSGSYDGGSTTDGRVSSMSVNVATASVAELTNAFSRLLNRKRAATRRKWTAMGSSRARERVCAQASSDSSS
jgi:superfamily I DNA and RNA helicase